MTRNTIVYLAHGSHRFYDQARYSITSLIDLLEENGRDDYEIVVYTDNSTFLPPHPYLRMVEVSSNTLHGWRGPLEYVHRIKIETLRHLHRDIGLPFVYVDCDTRWLGLPDEAFTALHAPRTDGERPAFYMHVEEKAIGNATHPSLARLLAGAGATLRAHGLDSDRTWTMWNSGVIGASVGAESYFDDALWLNDALLPWARSRTVVEQLSFSMLAAQRFELRPFDRWLQHYWPANDNITQALAHLYARLPAGTTFDALLRLHRATPWSEIETNGLGAVVVVPEWTRSWRKLRRSLNKRRIDLKALRLRMQAHH